MSLLTHLSSPAILAFLIGFLSRLFKSDLKIPEAVFNFISIYLLFAIGFKGATYLKSQDMGNVQSLLVLGIILCIIHAIAAYLLAKYAFKKDSAQSAAITAHYGSVSAVTFITAVQFLESQGLHQPGYFSAMVALMEIPALIIGIYLYETFTKSKKISFANLFSILNGKSIVLLLGGFVVGWLIQDSDTAALKKVFIEPFQGVLVLFLIEMGVLVAMRFLEKRQVSAKLIAMAIGISLVNGLISFMIAQNFTHRVEDLFLFTILGASASYIAAPVAVQTAMPQADLSEALTMSLGITFPINLLLGIPFYFWLVEFFYK